MLAQVLPDGRWVGQQLDLLRLRGCCCCCLVVPLGAKQLLLLPPRGPACAAAAAAADGALLLGQLECSALRQQCTCLLDSLEQFLQWMDGTKKHTLAAGGREDAEQPDTG